MDGLVGGGVVEKVIARQAKKLEDLAVQNKPRGE